MERAKTCSILCLPSYFGLVEWKSVWPQPQHFLGSLNKIYFLAVVASNTHVFFIQPLVAIPTMPRMPQKDCWADFQAPLRISIPAWNSSQSLLPVPDPPLPP